jgi:ABC-type glycerol-3-phosphate transport system substrate-binding protein
MSKTAKFLIVSLLLLVLVGAGAFAKQDVEKHTVHVGINPFSWIYGAYKIEVGMPLTGFVELAAQFNYVDGEAQRKLIGEDTDTYTKRLTGGAVVHLFPSQMATGFFISGRLMFLNFRYVDKATSTDYTKQDMSAGIDMGWRYLWEFEGGWGMFLQFYGGIERFFFNGDIADDFGFPILPVSGFHIGFHM